MNLDTLFKQFLKEKRYIQNVAENTIYFYELSFVAWKQTMEAAPITRLSINEFVIKMREQGRTPSTCNAYIRGFNVFLTWLFENGEIEKLAIKRLKLQKRQMQPLSEPQLKAIISYKPKDAFEKRTHVMMLTAIDTGARVDELLTLTKIKLDFENCLMTVIGKGNKERIIPFSIELRKVLFKYIKAHRHKLVFCTKAGTKMLYDNTRRDFNKIAKAVGIDKIDGTWHSLRRTFATNYIKSNGNPLKLQRMLGHSDLRQTNEYVKLITEDLMEEQERTSILNRLR